ncbi:MAG: hypothetical protein EPO61_12790 [Nitrospirae bacterium]|nr:MAG: hypothetical protein EPO61_12790 [Nitrospirota bacterium]
MIRRAPLSGLILSAFLTVSLLLGFPLQAAEPASQPAGNDERSLVREANRVLEEEIKLAAAPQIYLLLDLSARSLRIKGRGIELHRIELLSWDAAGNEESWGGVYRLRARPIVERPKVQPASDKDQNQEPAEPINLNDMPAEYLLQFDPGLLVNVGPPAAEHPWLWAKNRLREGWRRLSAWTDRSGDRQVPSRVLRLTLSQDQARSLAWSVTDGMPLLIGSVTAP